MADLNPTFVLLLGAVIVAVLPRRWGAPAMTITALVALVATLRLSDGTTVTYDFYGLNTTIMRVDSLSIPFATVFAILITLAAIYGWATMDRLERAAALATAGAGIGVVLAGDLLVLFLFWELKVTTVVLLILARRRASASAAAMRYLGVHLLGGVILLGGVLWHLVDTGTLEFGSLELSGASTLILIGFALCAAVVPLNAWLPDAYPQASAAGTVVLSAFTTKSAVYALARGFPGLEVLVWFGVAMAVFGVVFAILEDDIRRLLSYHIVSQVGFMVAAIGVGTAAAIDGATAHATAHVLYKGLLLMGVGAVVVATGRSRASELGGLSRTLPWVLIAYLVGAASISGVPLFSGFPAKELAVASVGDGGFSTAQWLLKFASVGTFASVALKLPAVTWFGKARAPRRNEPVPTTMYLAMGIAVAANIAIGVRPALLYDLLPTGVDFQPYTAAKILEALTLFSFTAIGIVLVRARLAPKATTTLDTDWVYRELPQRLGQRSRAVATDTPARPVEPIGAVIRNVVHTRWSKRRFSGPVAPGWLIGTTIAGAMVLVLAVSVIP